MLFRITSWITFIKVKAGNSFYFHFCTKNSFLYKNEKRYNGFDLDGPKGHSRGFNRRTP